MDDGSDRNRLLDRIDTDHEQVQLRYFVQPSKQVDLTATVYHNEFFRNWHKLDKVLDQNALGEPAYIGISNVLDDSLEFADELAVLRADLATDSAADSLLVRNNRRDYFSQGLHTALGIRPGGIDGTHDVEIGLRYHRDEEDRFQDDEFYAMRPTGEMVFLTRSGRS